MKIAFITNFCPHYRVKTYELLAKTYDIDFYFYSDGNDWFWQKQHGINFGNFNVKYLTSFNFLNIRISPTLPLKLIHSDYDIYIKCINGKFPLLTSYLIAKIRKKPFILWTGIWTSIDKPIQKLLLPLTKHLYKTSDAIVTYGTHVNQYLENLNVSSNKIFASTHAVDNKFYQKIISVDVINNYCKKFKLPKEPKIVLFIGRLEEIKGIPYLINAFAKLRNPNSFLVIGGTGSKEDELRKQVEFCGINDKTIFLGYVSLEETLILYSIATVLVLPSISVKSGKETWGLVVNEAFNKGLPVIASNAVGAAAGGLIENEINGLIVPERDSNALSDAIRVILENDDFQKKLSSNARKKIESWNNETMVNTFIQAVNFVKKS